MIITIRPRVLAPGGRARRPAGKILTGEAAAPQEYFVYFKGTGQSMAEFLPGKRVRHTAKAPHKNIKPPTVLQRGWGLTSGCDFPMAYTFTFCGFSSYCFPCFVPLFLSCAGHPPESFSPFHQTVNLFPISVFGDHSPGGSIPDVPPSKGRLEPA